MAETLGSTARWRRMLAAVALLSAACAADPLRRVFVEPAPMPAAVAFTFNDRDLFYGLTVSSCSGRTMWTLSDEQLVEPPARITYGVVPTGFTSVTGPLPLEPGCYKVFVSGPTSARFHIGADGRLVRDSAARPADAAQRQP